MKTRRNPRAPAGRPALPPLHVHELTTPVRLREDGREGVIVGRTLPTDAQPAHYDIRIGTAIVTPRTNEQIEVIGTFDAATLAAARERGREKPQPKDEAA